MSVHPEIRLLTGQDIDQLGDLYFPWTTKEKTIEKWQKYLMEQERGTRTACILENNEKLLGYGSLLEHSKYPPFKKHGIPEIHDVWVFKEARKNGFGSLLVEHLELLAKKNGYRQVGLGVGLYRDYGSAQKLYFRRGYCPDGEGISYLYESAIPGEKYPVDDDLILWLIKDI